jgi:glutamate---cysteine ligase / carboxylate-amine ligase
VSSLPCSFQPRSRFVAAGVEEEFHIVDLATRGLTTQADKIMEQLPAGSFSAELQQSVLEANSRATP